MDLAKIPAALYRRVGDVIYVSGHVGFTASGEPVQPYGHDVRRLVAVAVQRGDR